MLNQDLYQEYLNYQVYSLIDDCFSHPIDPINQSLCFETKYYLPDDLLVKVDRMSMGHSLEVRVPFLIIAWLNLRKFTGSYKTIITYQYLLRYLMQKYLPRKIIRKPKQGFSPPIKEWLRTDLKEYSYDMLTISKSNQYFNSTGIQYILDYNFDNKRDFQYQIWSLLVFQIWLKNVYNQN